MGYVNGSENMFRGFSGWDQAEEEARACMISADAPGCQMMMQKMRQQLDQTYTAAGSQLVGIAKSQPVLAEALAGAKNPQEAMARAQQLAKQIGSGAYEQAAYNLFYAQGRAGVEMLTSYIDYHPVFASITDLVHKGFKEYPEITKWAARVDVKGIDAAGIADLAGVASRVAVSGRQLGRVLGGDAGAAVAEAMSYLSLATGCVGSIAGGAAVGNAWGAAAGAVACGISVLASIFGGKSQEKPYTVQASFAPDETWTELVAQDAQRLAALLRYHYGIKSVAQLINGYTNLTGLTQSGKNGIALTGPAYPLIGSKNPLLGFNWAMLIQMARVAVSDTRYNFANVADSWPCHEAFIDKKYLGLNVGFAITKMSMLDISLMVQAGERALSRGPTDKRYAASITLLEWVRFFGATCRADPGAMDRKFETVSPVRYREAGNYDGGRWTDATGDWLGGRTPFITDYNRDQDCYAAGTIRLAAAFSYLVLQYHRGRKSVSKFGPSSMTVDRDLIASLPAATPSYTSLFRIPVSPKGTKTGTRYTAPSMAVLASQMRQRASKLGGIEVGAKAQANIDARAKFGPVVNTSEAFQKKLFLATSSQVQQRAQVDPRVAAGQFKLTDAAQANIDAAKELQNAQQSSSSGGGTGLLLAGAAALAAVRFLK